MNLSPDTWRPQVSSGYSVTETPEQPQVKCPKCGETYDVWRRESFSPYVGPVIEQVMDLAASATCPECDTKVYYDDLA